MTTIVIIILHSTTTISDYEGLNVYQGQVYGKKHFSVGMVLPAIQGFSVRQFNRVSKKFTKAVAHIWYHFVSYYPTHLLCPRMLAVKKASTFFLFFSF